MAGSPWRAVLCGKSVSALTASAPLSERYAGITSSSPSASGTPTCGRSGTSAWPAESCANARSTASIAAAIGSARRTSSRVRISIVARLSICLMRDDPLAEGLDGGQARGEGVAGGVEAACAAAVGEGEAGPEGRVAPTRVQIPARAAGEPDGPLQAPLELVVVSGLRFWAHVYH